jgi:hypothetical protein
MTLLRLLWYVAWIGAFAVTPLIMWLGWVVLTTGRRRS